jgi:hypothetical protein
METADRDSEAYYEAALLNPELGSAFEKSIRKIHNSIDECGSTILRKRIITEERKLAYLQSVE